jgi:hypothetical protein
MRTTFLLAVFIGMALYAWASLFRRVPGALPPGSGGFQWPWQRREWFTRTGHRARIVGLILWLAGAVGVAVLTFTDR